MQKLAIPLLLVVLAVAASGCSGADRAQPASAASKGPACPVSWKAGWQRLANRIHAPVYCPSWLPDPLTGQIPGHWSLVSVDPDRSYLVGFIWQEPQSGEIHVNLRGYPGRTTIPTCLAENTVGEVTHRSKVPCFADPHGRRQMAGNEVTVYTVNQDADLWHVLYAWHHDGSLYTVSEHVTPPFNYAKVVRNLDRMLNGLVLVSPTTS